MFGEKDIGGNGLVTAPGALVSFGQDPQMLQRKRVRFDIPSPPRYGSDRSGTTTRSQSPIELNEEELLRQEKINRERSASKCSNQFKQQKIAEWELIIEPSEKGTPMIDLGVDSSSAAYENVKKRWIEQGIWKSTWFGYRLGNWKHEEPLELESLDSEEGLVTAGSHTLSPPLKSKSSEELAERQRQRERDREASRPYHQLVYQVSKERERVLREADIEGATLGSAISVNINTIAYENVKDTWTKRLIWNKRWGVLPGMTWKHEDPLEQDAMDSPGGNATDQLVNGNGTAKQENEVDGLESRSFVEAGPHHALPGQRLIRRSQRIQMSTRTGPEASTSKASTFLSGRPVRPKSKQKSVTNPERKSAARPQRKFKCLPSNDMRGRARK